MMNKPVIIINGIEHGMIEPKARAWRKFMEFDTNKKDLQAADFVEAHCEILTEVFDGITKDDLLDNLDLSDVLSTYNKCFSYLTGLLSSKLSELGKSEGVDESAG